MLKKFVRYSASQSCKNLDNGDSVPKAVAKGVCSRILS